MQIETRKVNLGYIGEIDNYNGNLENALAALNTNQIKENCHIDMTDPHDKRKFDNDVYYIFYYENTAKIYKQIPLVKDNEVFTWHERTLKNRVRNMWTTVKMGCLTFNITAYTETGDVAIRVGYGRGPFCLGASYMDNYWLRGKGYDNCDILESILAYVKNIKEQFANI